MLAPSNSDPELPLRIKAAQAVNIDSVAELCGLLRQRGWQTAKDIQQLRPQWNERFIRLLANAAGRQITSGPGTPGYCLTEEVETEELKHAARSLMSQGKAMLERGIGLMQIVALRATQAKLLNPPKA
jgi:hypothetical protein